MILFSLCDLARQEDLLANADYEPKPVAWILSIGDGGRFLGATPTAAEDKRGKARAKVFSIPRRKGRTSAAVADFAVDKSEYVLGVEPSGKRDQADLDIRRELFRAELQKALDQTQSPALVAIDAFLSDPVERNKAVTSIAAANYASNDLFAFEFQGALLHERSDVRGYFSASRKATKKGSAQCLVCGDLTDVAKKHPSIQPRGGTTSGVALISFNSDAFESYGLEGNNNAPVCQDCADAYTTALKRLLSERYPHPNNPGQTLPPRFVYLSSDTTALFWSDREATVLDLLADYFGAPNADSVKALLQAPHKGRQPALGHSIQAALELTNRFYCLILTGGQGRAVLRAMHSGLVEDLESNIADYFRSIDIGSDFPLPLLWLLRSVVLQGKLENLPPALVTDVFLSITFGHNFPRTLLARAVSRCRAERAVSRDRAAVLRAYLIRNNNLEITVALDTNNPNSAYRLGRLMALLERIQAAAQNNPNKTLVDRYYGAASTRPITVFPRLIANAQNHLSKLKRGLAIFYHVQLSEILDGLSAFPSTLNLEDQGLFALGYYHQRSFKKPESVEPATENEKGESE